MRLEARFGDRMVPAFCERPNSIWAMIAEAAAQNPDGEALVCGDRRLTWREVVQQSAQNRGGISETRPAKRRPRRDAARQPHRIRADDVCRARMPALVTVLLSTRQQKPEIAYVLTDCGAKAPGP